MTTRRSVIAWGTVALAYATIAAAWLWEYDLTRDTPLYSAAAMAAFLTTVLGVHLGIATLVATGVLAATRRWRYALSLLPLAGFLLWPVAGSIGPDANAGSVAQDDVVIMSINLRAGADGLDVVEEAIERYAPSIILFQEYAGRWAELLPEAIGNEYPHRIEEPRPDPYGIAVFSRVPPRGSPDDAVVRFGTWGIPTIRATYDVGGDDVTIYNVHLKMPLAGGGHAEQRRQLSELVDTAAGSDTPIFMAGDFNFTETTWHHRVLTDAGLRAAWDVTGRGRHVTWQYPGMFRLLPGLRLDHVFVSRGLRITGIERARRGGSDHWPVVVSVEHSV